MRRKQAEEAVSALEDFVQAVIDKNSRSFGPGMTERDAVLKYARSALTDSLTTEEG